MNRNRDINEIIFKLNCSVILSLFESLFLLWEDPLHFLFIRDTCLLDMLQVV